MEGGFDKNQTISDYALMLRALLPDAVGFYCVDRAAAVFFEMAPETPVEFTAEYHEAVASILVDP